MIFNFIFNVRKSNAYSRKGGLGKACVIKDRVSLMRFSKVKKRLPHHGSDFRVVNIKKYG